MKRTILMLALLLWMFSLSACTKNIQHKPELDSNSITICAASSLKAPLEEIKPKFEKSENIELFFNLASSGTLQKQIEEGAPADLFISAAKKQMDELERKNLIDKASRKDLFKNRLVLIVSEEYKDMVKTAADLVNLDAKISIGEPGTVPAGQYAKETLDSILLWDELTSKMVLAKDVKQVLTYVEKGEVAAGIVYASDTVGLKNSIVLQTFEENSHSSIIYPVAIVSESKNKDSAQIFIDYLLSPEAQQVFIKYGFDRITR